VYPDYQEQGSSHAIIFKELHHTTFTEDIENCIRTRLNNHAIHAMEEF
jgi:hypothetical protein